MFFSAFLNIVFRKTEKITKQYKICHYFCGLWFPRERWTFKDSGGANLVTAVIAAAHSAPPFSCVVDAALRWEIARTRQCGTEKKTKS